MRGTAALTVVLLWSARPAAAEPRQLSPAACRQKIAGLEAIAREGDERAKMVGPFISIRGLKPPLGSKGDGSGEVTATVARGLLETRFEGQAVAGATDVQKAEAISRALTAMEETRRMLYAAQPRLPPVLIGIWLDRRLSARQALPLLEALAARYDVGVLASDEPPKRGPFPPHVTRRLEEIRAIADAAKKFQLVEDTTRTALAGCQAPPGAKGMDAVVAALKACSCAGADLEMLEAIMSAVNDEPRVFLRRIKVQADAKQAVTLEEGATVQDLWDRLPAGGGPIAVRWAKKAP
jgi:hypothetical protein